MKIFAHAFLIITLMTLYPHSWAKDGCLTDRDCIVSFVDDVVHNKKLEQLDVAIEKVNMFNSLTAWKNNALGALYLLKRDNDSLIKAEAFLLKAEKEGATNAIHNLAELYFLKQDYEQSKLYLEKYFQTGIKMPSKDYVEWARLYAQHLYFGYGMDVNLTKSKNLFEQIKNIDQTGVSQFFLAQFSLNNHEVEEAIEYLVASGSKGYLQALLALGDLYRKDEYSIKNSELALEYYLEATKHQSNIAHMNLFIMYREVGDVKAMREHLIKAAELGNEQALNFIEKVYKKNSEN